MRIAFRVDGSTAMGFGHIMRCLALAEQLKQNHDIYFLSSALPSNIAAKIDAAGATLILVSIDSVGFDAVDDADSKQLEMWQKLHANECLAHVNEKLDLLFVDHYQLSAPFSDTMRSKAEQIVVIDDLANRVHDCDILVDTNFYHDYKTRYNGLVPAHCQTLLGPTYAFLRGEFFCIDNKMRANNHFLVCFGGSDPTNLTERVVDILTALKSSTFTADIIVGPGYQYIHSLLPKIQGLSGLNLHQNCTYMGSLMQGASFMIGAGGSMHWERAKSGVAGLIITLAENQKETTRALHDQLCCVWLGNENDIADEQIQKAISNALQSPDQMRYLASNAAKLVEQNQSPSFVMDTISDIVKRNS
ncbi:UDP-2,4-diacetamido-2,4,6-trideoxy-beta-L-altropyranose hydrolase [Alteromonas sp. 1_MG-2023]|uniref:UDP-2,4-diacetamido-2,4, 6-trideoxy-beta-L-altropyranose hydrolase n=1 Tax=Alteromonas sp. 1_MG-2023 TaxID=3062669 RepID=UPI0026E14193|nr:UDP-2,4-diacetamido-2,4,6-trideoxy-beta-L-altropyranose hydrolase [Alteromonas sp. 1_MG-2023]MDO6568442.1 UDP-2,4-diacetamido-2,4,6-trideoxy-beta-L-altropyranose hydrolase [Alteromonas sp. 1_MG-2023]